MSSRQVLVLYGTQTGNSRAVAAELGTQAASHGFEAVVRGMETFKSIDFAANTMPLVLITSSTGNGDAPDNAERFLRYVKKRTTPRVFEGARFCVCALGDSNYELFCEVGKQFDVHLERLGGTRFLKRCDVDEVDGIETHIEPWQSRLWEALSRLGEGGGADGANEGAGAGADVGAGEGEGEGCGMGAAVPTGSSAEKAEGDDDGAGIDAEHPLHAPIVCARWLTAAPSAEARGDDVRPEAEERAVLHLELDLSGGCRAIRHLEPGDALAVVPANEPKEVELLLDTLRVDADERVDIASPPAHLAGDALTAREALSSRVDIGSVSTWPPLPLLRLLVKAAGAAAEATLLAHIGRATAPVSSGARSAHVELLRRLAAAPPLLELLDVLPPLAPRWYSLASSHLACPERAHLCLSLTKYVTTDAAGRKQLRRGVASHYLAALAAPLLCADAAPDEPPTVRVYRRESSGNELRLPKAVGTPIVLIGPGTGLAPFRAFLQHRRYQAPRKQLGSTTLYFGCRSKADDYLYGEELELMASTGAIRLRTAFSRDADLASAGYWRGVRLNIPYVQDLLEEDGLRLCEALFDKGAHLYVCGDGQAMAADVHTALLRLVEATLKVSAAAAEEALSKLVAEGRYSREVWI